MKQGNVCFYVEGSTHLKAAEPRWFQPQNYWCSVDAVSGDIPALHTSIYSLKAALGHADKPKT